MLETIIFGVPIALTLSVFSAAVFTPPTDFVMSDFTIADELQDRGYTDDTISRLIHDEINKIELIASTHRESKTITLQKEEFTLFSDFADILKFKKQVTAAQITLGLVEDFADVHLYESIDGQFVDIQIRIHDGNQTQVQFNDRFIASSEDPQELFRFAAEAIVRHLEPYVYASYLFNSESKSASEVMVPSESSGYAVTEAYLLRKLRLSEDLELRTWYENLLGIVDVRQGNLESARSHFEAAHELDPKFFYDDVNEGLLFMETGEYADAIREFREAETIAADLPILYVYWAHALYGLGRPKEALRKLDRVHALAPDLAEAYALRAKIAEEHTSRIDLVQKYEDRYKLSIERKPRQVFYLAM